MGVLQGVSAPRDEDGGLLVGRCICSRGWGRRVWVLQGVSAPRGEDWGCW